MSYAPGAPELIWAIPDNLLDDGAKLTLMRLWSKADHAVQQAPAPCDVWSAARPDHTPTQALHADLAEARGCSVRKIRRHLTKLRALGLAEANGRLVRLTPPANGHAVTADGQSCPSTGDRQRADRDLERAPDDRERASADRKGSAHLNPPVPPTPPSPAEVERATPTPSVKPAGSGVLDPWPERVREASQSAHYYLDQTADSTHAGSYSQLMRKARADYGDDGVLEALRKWEDLGFVKGRPPAGKLWHSPWRSWVEGVLGIEAPAKARPGHRPRLSCVPPSNTDIALLRPKGQEKWEALAAEERAEDARAAARGAS